MLDAQCSADGRQMARWRARLLLSFLAIAGTVGGVAPAAGASTFVSRGDGGGTASHSGNGKFIKNSFSIDSPTIQRGVQNISNTAVGGSNPTQAALCKRRFRHCRIRQKIIVDP